MLRTEEWVPGYHRWDGKHYVREKGGGTGRLASLRDGSGRDGCTVVTDMCS